MTREQQRAVILKLDKSVCRILYEGDYYSFEPLLLLRTFMRRNRLYKFEPHDIDLSTWHEMLIYERFIIRQQSEERNWPSV